MWTLGHMAYSNLVFTLDTVYLHHVSNLNTQLVHTMHSFWTHCSFVPCIHIQTSFIGFRWLSGTQGLFKTCVRPECTNYPCVHLEHTIHLCHVFKLNTQTIPIMQITLSTYSIHNSVFTHEHTIHHVMWIFWTHSVMSTTCATWTHTLSILGVQLEHTA